jgi:MoaA/NifB/PqqE/SkfB family radical SAM enzyme
MKKHRKIKDVIINLENNTAKIYLLINKRGLSELIYSTRIYDDAVNKYLDLCKKYGKKINYKQLQKLLKDG